MNKHAGTGHGTGEKGFTGLWKKIATKNGEKTHCPTDKKKSQEKDHIGFGPIMALTKEGHRIVRMKGTKGKRRKTGAPQQKEMSGRIRRSEPHTKGGDAANRK